MILKNKKCIVFDIEVLKNIVTITTKDTETKQIKVFELSQRLNTIDEAVEYFTSDTENKIFVGYNNKHYDDPIFNYIIELYYNKYFEKKTVKEICQSIYNLGKIIIENKEENLSKWKKYKYKNYFESVDLLTMLFSKALRVSLKETQVTMQYENVQEFVTDWDSELPENKFDKLISYNINDVNSTEKLLEKCKKSLELRVSIEKDFGINCLSVDNVNLGMQILEQEYIKRTGIDKKVLESLRSPCDSIDLEKVIFPWINYDTPILQELLKELKSNHNVSPGRKGYEKTILFGGMKVTIGVGGIHGDNGTCIIKPNDDELLLDSDVTSLYPSMIIQHELYPSHLGKIFLDIYKNIYDRRLYAKAHKIKNTDLTLKYALNGLSGNLQNEYSWVYSPFTVMQIRINGQLLLLKFCEKLLSINCKLKQLNTDGVMYLCKKDKVKELENIIKEFEKWSKLNFETEEFKEVYQLAINDYFAVTPNYEITHDFDKDIKKKGFFLTKLELGKGLQPKIIPETIIRYFVDKIPIETNIKECKDIRKFLQSEKTGKQWTVEYNNEIQQRINRFYASTNGYYLWKYKIENGTKAYTNMLKGQGVNILNELLSDEDLNWEYSLGKTFNDIYNVDYNYYINQCTKIKEQLKPRQMSLFE